MLELNFIVCTSYNITPPSIIWITMILVSKSLVKYLLSFPLTVNQNHAIFWVVLYLGDEWTFFLSFLIAFLFFIVERNTSLHYVPNVLQALILLLDIHPYLLKIVYLAPTNPTFSFGLAALYTNSFSYCLSISFYWIHDCNKFLPLGARVYPQVIFLDMVNTK